MEFLFRRVPSSRQPKPVGDGIAELPLSRGMVALINEDDLDKVARFRWEPHRSERGLSWYARTRSTFFARGKRRVPVLLHRLVLLFPLFQVDHIDRNGLNNLRVNLRASNASQNAFNIGPKAGTSKFKGVHWDCLAQRWIASIRHNRKLTVIGRFKDEELAAIAYDRFASCIAGEFAYLNFP